MKNKHENRIIPRQVNLIDEYERLRSLAQDTVEKMVADRNIRPLSYATCKTIAWDSKRMLWIANVHIKMASGRERPETIEYIDSEMSRLYDECNLTSDMYIKSKSIRGRVISAEDEEANQQ